MLAAYFGKPMVSPRTCQQGAFLKCRRHISTGMAGIVHDPRHLTLEQRVNIIDNWINNRMIPKGRCSGDGN